MNAQEVPQGRLHTPFYNRMKEIDKLNNWTTWAGYSSPHALYCPEVEYFAIRNSTGVFDITPMIKYRISGPDALEYIDRLVTRNMRKIKPGRVAYAVWCDDRGQVLDDGTIFHLAEGVYRLCSQERHLPWFTAAAIGFDVEIKEETEDIAALAVQGPTSFSILKNMGLDGLENLKLFGLMYFDFKGEKVMVSRTGFTGDLGYELWVNSEKAIELWDDLFAAGELYGIRAIGSEALDLARIEAGYLAPLEDFLPAEATVRTGRTRSPLELGMEWLVDFDKPNFNGRRALIDEKKRGSTWRLVKLDIEGNKEAHSSYIFEHEENNDAEIGFLTSSAWSPICKQNIAIGTVKTPHGNVGDNVWVEIYYQRELHWSRVMAKATVVGKPFWFPPRRSQTPPLPY